MGAVDTEHHGGVNANQADCFELDSFQCCCNCIHPGRWKGFGKSRGKTNYNPKPISLLKYSNRLHIQRDSRHFLWSGNRRIPKQSPANRESEMKQQMEEILSFSGAGGERGEKTELKYQTENLLPQRRIIGAQAS